MKLQLLLAALVSGAIAAWMWSGDLVIAGSADVSAVPPPALRLDADAEPFRVRVRTIEAEPLERALRMRGRTRADALVQVAAETVGRVEDRRVQRGDVVSRGDILCQLDQGTRNAELQRAKAEQAKAQLEFDAATKLLGRGFESATRVATTRAALDGATAAVAAATEELERTTIRAPLSGRVQEPLADVGSTLLVGDVCATIVDKNPIIVVGEVAERRVPAVRLGAEADVQLLTGESVRGTVTFISSTSNIQTRTFTVELEVPNPEEVLLAGVTAEAEIPLPDVQAHRLSPGILTLQDDGTVGVRTVTDANEVAFLPVTIVEQNLSGFFVTGLPPKVTIITVGQDYVIDGQAVTPVPEDTKA
ncbi:MAG: efflux RND transporter periplasmic adaptor subunit [Pseudomonadota bacterium]